jgi:valyl-tRNA synthetase
MFMNVDRLGVTGIPAFKAVTLEDRWILSRFNRVSQGVNDTLATYRFHEAANQIYDFFWGEFCDWYLELIKPRMTEGASEETARLACGNLVSLFDAALRLLHPVMPFITEEIWQTIYDGKPPLQSIALAAYPRSDERLLDLSTETEMAVLQDLIVSVRNLRAELKVEQKTKIPIELFAHDSLTKSLVEQNREAIERLGNVSTITEATQSQASQAPSRATARFDVRIVYEKKIDIVAERERLMKELEKMEKEIANGQRQLSNDGFLAKAPANIVEGLKKRNEELVALREKTKKKLQELK